MSIRKWQSRKLKKWVLSTVIIGVLLLGIFIMWQFSEKPRTSSNLPQQTLPAVSKSLTEKKPQDEIQNKATERPNTMQETKDTQIQTPSQAPLQPQSVSEPSYVSKANQQEALKLYNQGLKLYYNRQFNEGLTLFNKALTLDPDCYQALNGKGATYAFLGRYDDGIALIQKALKLEPDFVYGHFNLGLANELAGRWNEAIAAYHSAIALDEKDVWSYYGIASIYGRQGNVENVVAYLSQAIALDPDVKAVAKDEKDFDPVKNDSRFQALLSPAVSLAPQNFANLKKIPVLYYHSIMNVPGNELRMPPEQFEAQMKYLSVNGYHVLTLDQLHKVLYENGTAPEKPVAITFDDGYSDNFTQAFPIMQKYQFSGTVFMVSSFVNGQGFLTENQLQQLQAAGWTIGGHTTNHTNLTTVSSDSVIKELKESREFLEGILGQHLKYFAYPFGGYNATIARAIKGDGYVMAFTTERGWANQNTDPFLIKRVYCYANMGIEEFERRLSNPNY